MVDLGVLGGGLIQRPAVGLSLCDLALDDAAEQDEDAEVGQADPGETGDGEDGDEENRFGSSQDGVLRNVHGVEK